ncbi:cell division protein FtsA [Candidatus Omnitrophota bacterium]
MKKENIITVLDIGASKVCCLIGLPKKDNLIDVLGYGIVHHDYLKHGVVVDIKGFSETINKAVCAAEEVSGKKIHSVYFNICGSHIRGLRSHGEVIISDRDNEITKRDLDRVMSSARSIHMPYERDIIYTVKRGFVVDGEKGIVNPVGMFGLKLETDLYLVTGRISSIDNIKKAIRQAGIPVKDSVISGIASSTALLSPHEKDLGVVLVDIGADMTEILIFFEGALVHLSVLAMGGDSITKAISEKFCMPEGAAERIKIENGTLDEDRKSGDITLKVDSQRVKIPSDELKSLLLAEYSKIFDAIRKDITDSGFGQEVSSGVVVCGQPTMMDGCLELAELKLNFPVKMGHIMGLGSSPKPLPSHIYAAGMGLLKYARDAKLSKRSLLTMSPKNLAMAVIERARNLYNDYF